MSELPEVYIYMLESMDGIGTGSFLEKAGDTVGDYFNKEYSFGSKAILCGRPTYEEGIPGPIDLTKFKDQKVERKDYVAPKKNDYYTIAIDPKGKLKWTSGFFCIFEDYGRKQKANSVTILTEEVKDDYLAYLKSIEVSYIFAGKDKINVRTSLEKLKTLFGVNKVVLQGGPTIDGAFISDDLIDAISIIICPCTAEGGETLFKPSKYVEFKLVEFRELSSSNIWLRYIRKKN